MRPKNVPSTEYGYAYDIPPIPGNTINGLGKAEIVRPTKIAPDDFTVAEYEWKDIWDFFHMTVPWPAIKQIIFATFGMRNANGPIAKSRKQVDDPVAMANEIKEKARELGAGIVGISYALDDLLLYDGDEPYPYKYAISIGTPQDWDEMKHVPETRAGVEVVSTYRESSVFTNKLAKYIRSLGWPAESFAFGRDMLHIPTAIQAGLGELGKHGSLICKEYGSNFRLTTVLTDLPMAVDAPVDIGVQDVCLTCQACTKQCPPGAISEKRQTVRGIEKWYVDYDKCAPFFVKTLGCSICVEVCPWSMPGRGPKLSETVMARRNSPVPQSNTKLSPQNKPGGRAETLSERLQRNVQPILFMSMAFFMWGILGAMIRRAYKKARAAGRTFYVDHLPTGIK